MINLQQIFTAMLMVAPKDNVKYYFNAVHIQHCGAKCLIEATDGAMALRVSVPSAWFKGILYGVGDSMLITRESLAKAVDRHAVHDGLTRGALKRTYYRGGKLDVMTGNFPFLDTAKPRPDGDHSVGIDTDRLGVLLGAIGVLRKGCARNVSRLAVGGNVGLAGHVDNVDYVAFLAPASL